MTHRLIAIGASTGGPDAVARVLKAFPAGMPPIVIVQHMPEGFTGKFAARLNSFCSIRVEEAHDGATLEPGLALIAPGTKCHMIVERNNADLVVRLIDAPPVMHHRPSVDVLFNSCAAVVGKRTVAALLTGMGTDGARGLLALRQAGAVTIAQDGESSVVYGMPMEAAAIGAAMHVLPILKIGESMVHATYGGDIQDVA